MKEQDAGPQARIDAFDRGRILEKLIDQMGDRMYVVDATTLKIVIMNEAFHRDLGYSYDELINQSILKILPEKFIAEGITERIMNALSQVGRFMYEGHHLRKDGTAIPVEVNVVRSTVDGRDFNVAIARDITERDRVMRLLKESEERYRTLVEQAFEGYAVSREGFFIEVNGALASMVGYKPDEIIGRHLSKIVTPDTLPLVMERVRANYTKPYEAALLHRDGHRIPVEVCGRTQPYQGQIARVTVFRDLTAKVRADEERKALEQQINRVQRLESLGTLAGGVAHDFNNILQGLTLTIEKVESGGEKVNQKECAREAKSYIQRGKQLIEQIMNFTRTDVSNFAMVDMNAIVDEAAKITAGSAKGSVDLRIKKGAILKAQGSEVQILQALSNLLTNALFEVQSQSGNKIIEVETFDVGPNHPDVSRLTLPHPPYVGVAVRDSGPGIPPRLRGRIFEPFFTTKEPGKGIGLGLAQVHRIVTNHLGHVEIAASPFGGAAFVLHFPVHQPFAPKALQNPKADPSQAAKEEQKCEGLLVLLVDDEADMVSFFEEILKDAGYRVAAFSDPVLASEYLKNNPSEIDVVLSDQTMPAMTGSQLAQTCRDLRPELPFVLMTGFAPHGRLREGGAQGITKLMQKPFSAQDLLKVLNDIFNATGHKGEGSDRA